MNTSLVIPMSSKTVKLQIYLFWFIYALHTKNMIPPDMVINCLDLIKDVSFLESFFSSASSIKHKYSSYMDTNCFPFIRHTNHYKHSI